MTLTEKIAWSSSPDFPGVEVITARYNQRPWTVYHETYTICNINEFFTQDGSIGRGAAEWVYRGKLHQSPASSLMLMEPGEIHSNTKSPPPSNFSVALLDAALVNAVAAESGLKPNPHFKVASCSDPAAFRAFLRLHAAIAKQASLLHRQSLLVNCIMALLSAHCESNLPPLATPGRRRLQLARDFLEQHFAENVTLDQLAEIADLSRFHFLRAFTREFSLTPHAWQISRRVERVRFLIKAGIPLHSIDAGFADQSHLIRHFKSAHGVTPGQYAGTLGNPGTPSETGTSRESNSVLYNPSRDF